MWCWIQGFFAAMAFVSSALAKDVAPVGSEGSAAADTGYFQEAYRVTDGVWVLAEPKFQVQPIGNVTVVEQSDGLVLVDAGGSPGAGRRIVQMVRSLSPKPVKAIIISEWHGDKSQGLSELLRQWPTARTIATKLTQSHLSDPKTMNSPAVPDASRNAAYVKEQRDAADYFQGLVVKAKSDSERQGVEAAARIFRQYALDVDGALTLTVNEGFDDRLTIPDTLAPVEAMFLGRANTDGDAVVWLPKQKILVTGETVILPFPYGFESYPADWIGVLTKLRAMDFRTLVPGHGMPQHDRSQIDAMIAALQHARAQVGALAAQGLTLEEIQAKVDFGADQKTFVGSDPWLGRWFKEYWVKPIVTSAFQEAKGQHIVQGLSG
jgi:glyoxylase-like metal-dependent hydrolase (beta-lactamase superfamily II)